MISLFLVLNAGENDAGSTTSVSMSSTARPIPFSDWAYSLQVPLQGYFRACHVPTGADKKTRGRTLYLQGATSIMQQGHSDKPDALRRVSY